MLREFCAIEPSYVSGEYVKQYANVILTMIYSDIVVVHVFLIKLIDLAFHTFCISQEKSFQSTLLPFC